MEKAEKVHATKQNNNERRTPRASSHNKLARRVNDLLSTGAGDAAWRIFYYAHSMFRQPRNPQGGGLPLGVWPSGDEWWNFYAHFEPPSFKRDIAKRGISWPQTLAGYPEGANVINPMCKFAFGHKIYKGFWWGAIGLWAEGNNFNPRLIGTSPGVYRNSHFWRQAQTQRGAIYISNKTDKEIKNNINKCVKLGIPRSAANRVCERRINVSSSVNAVGTRPYNQILSQGLLYQLYAPAVVKGYKIWKRGYPNEHMSDYYSTLGAAKVSPWGAMTGNFGIAKGGGGGYSPEIVSPVLHRKYATHQVLQSIFHYLITFRGSEHQRALFCRKIPPRTFEVAAFDPSTPVDYITQNYPFLKKVTTTGPLTVCDVGFDFQDFLSRQFVLAPAYGTGVKKTRRAMKYGYYGGETIGTGGNVSTLAIDREGYPRVEGGFGESTPIYGIDLPIDLAKIGQKGKTAYPNSLTTGETTSDKKQAIRLTKIRAPYQPVAYFRTNPSNKDKNAFCMAGYYIHFTGVQNMKLNCKIVIRKGIYATGDTVDIIYIDKNTSYSVKTNKYTYRIYNKLNYFRRGLKGSFSFWLESAVGQSEINFAEKDGYNQDEVSNFEDKISIRIEIAHLLDMRPSILDAYAFLRIATTKGGVGGDFHELPGDVDNIGHDYMEARVISDNYERFGSAVNPHGAQVVPKLQNYLNNSPIYESTRKFVTSNMKMVSRKNIVNYAEESGNGVLYFDRFAMGMANKGIDMFRGIGPSVDSVGWFDRYGEGKRSGHVTFVPIMKDKVYYVWSHNKETKDDYVTYNGEPYYHKQKFRGAEKDGVVVDFLETKGSGVGAYEMEGIRKKPPQDSESNEWIMFVTFNPYHWADTNIWKTSIFGDQTCFLHNRCLFKAPDIEGNFRAEGGMANFFAARTKEASMMRDVFYNFNTRSHLGIGDMSTYVQAPPIFNTWRGYNTPNDASNLSSGEALGWAESCRLVTNIYRVTSVERFGNRGLTDPRTNLIRVELDRKLENGKNPNFSVGSGPFDGSYMDHGKMENQKFRSDRNGLVEYIISGRGGNGYQCGTKSYNRRNGVMIGDYGAKLNVNKDVGSMTGGYSIYGSCHPRFYFLKLIPEISPGAQLRIDPYVQMEYYIRAMHGGYVDEKNKLQSNLLLPGTDIFEAGAMQTSVNHDIDSVTSAIDNNPDVDIETIDPNDIETSTTN